MKSPLPQILWPIVRMICMRHKIIATAPDLKRLNDLLYESLHLTYVAKLNCKTALHTLTIHRGRGGEESEIVTEEKELANGKTVRVAKNFTFDEVIGEIKRHFEKEVTGALKDGFRLAEDFADDGTLTTTEPPQKPVLTFSRTAPRMKWLLNLIPKAAATVNQKSRPDTHPKSHLSAHSL